MIAFISGVDVDMMHLLHVKFNYSFKILMIYNGKVSCNRIIKGKPI